MITATEVTDLIETFKTSTSEGKDEMSTMVVSITSPKATPASLEGLEKIIQMKLGSAVKNIMRTKDGKMSFSILHDDAEALKTNMDAMLKKIGLTGTVSVV